MIVEQIFLLHLKIGKEKNLKKFLFINKIKTNLILFNKNKYKKLLQDN